MTQQAEERKEPTEAQKKAGNYQKDHVFKHGMRFSIENKAGTTRRGTGKGGKPWEFTMAHDYGYVRGSKGKDKDHVDVFFGPDRDNADGKVYVIDQDDDEGNFDEHKAMLGFPDASSAYAAYHENYPEGHAGFRAITEMSIPEFRKWAYVGAAGGKRKRVSELAAYRRGGSVEEFPDGAMVEPAELERHFVAGAEGKPDEHCNCGNNTIMMADGGSVDDAVAELPAFVGYRGRRKERNNDREGAKEVPLQALRGLVAGTLGFGGDIEGLLRTVGHHAPKLTKPLLGDGDTTPALPTSDFYKDILPLKPTSAAGRAAGEAGSMAGGPLSLPVLKAVRAAAPAAKALGKEALRAVDRGVMGEGALSKVFAPARPAFAVKPPGGNWYDPDVEKATKSARGWEPEDAGTAAGQPMTVADWMERRLNKYIRNQMGTVDDPLLKLEQEGALHLTPEQLEQGASRAAMKVAPGEYSAPQAHRDLTGRQTRTAWEAISDDPILIEQAQHMRGLRGAPSWLNKLADDAPVYDLDVTGIDHLGFDHVRDYLEQATNAFTNWRKLTPEERFRSQGDNVEEVQRMVDRNIDIDPDKLSMVSLPDAVRGTSNWNKMLAEMRRIEDRNKGIKQVLKQYETGHPNEGFQWVELGPEGLADEGNAMGHCVGGYCREVEGGDTRIVSLRDKEGQPHVTVELRPGKKWTERSGVFYDNPELEKPWVEFSRASAAAGNRKPDYIKDFPEWIKKNDPEMFGRYESIFADSPPDIRQIKGKQNAAPVAQYLPAVQDFVRNMGPWGEVRDLQNSGLRRTRDVFGPTELDTLKQRGQTPSGDYLSPDEIEMLQGYFADPKARPFAQGGTVMGEETVGQARFNPSAQGRPMGMAQPQPMLGGGGGGGSAPGAPGLPQPGPQFTDTVYDAENDPLLRAQLQMGGRGGMINGAGAFLGGAYNPFGFETGPSAGEIIPNSSRPEHSLDQLRATAGALGLDPSSYAESYSPGRFGFMNNRVLEERLDPGRASVGSPRDAGTLYNDLNEYTKDYYAIDHMTPNGRNMERTLYVKRDGKLLPVSNPTRRSSRQDNGFFDDEFKGALMTIGPAMLGGMGGWSSLVGQAGTAAAPYINAAGNAALGYLRGGSQGALSSLISSAGGAAGGWAGGQINPSLDGVGRQVGSRVAGAINDNRRRS